MINKTKKILLFGLLSVVLVSITFFIKLLFFDNNFYYAGTLEVTKVNISARLPAAINEVRVHEGDRVTQGQTLITFACEDFKIAARLAQEDYDRNKQLVKKNFISLSAFDLFRQRMEDANTKVGWCTLVSPLNATVLSRDHEPGEWMIPGTEILVLADVRDIYAYIYVPHPLVVKLSLGMKLKGYLPEIKGREFIGKITKINDEAEFTPKNVQTQEERQRLIYGVKVSFLESNVDEILKPGMTIEVALPK